MSQKLEAVAWSVCLRHEAAAFRKIDESKARKEVLGVYATAKEKVLPAVCLDSSPLCSDFGLSKKLGVRPVSRSFILPLQDGHKRG